MRRTEKIMKGWLFTYKEKEKTLIDLPHTWNALDGQDVACIIHCNKRNCSLHAVRMYDGKL